MTTIEMKDKSIPEILDERKALAAIGSCKTCQFCLKGGSQEMEYYCAIQGNVNPIACNLMKDRLNKIGTSDVRIIGGPKTIDELKALEPFQFQNWVIDRIGGVPSPRKSSDMGIDGYTFMARDPVQVKQSEGIGRNVVDNFETAIRREHKTTGYIVAFSFAKRCL